MTEYRWSPSYAGRRVNPQVVGDTVDKIEANEGWCPAPRLVKEAQPEDSPLHRLFTWNDTKAAHLYRVWEAERVLRNIWSVKVESEGGSDIDGPAYVSIARGEGSERRRGYMPTGEVVRNKSLRRQVVRECLGQLKGLQRRYRYLTQFSLVWESIEKTEAAMAEEGELDSDKEEDDIDDEAEEG